MKISTNCSFSGWHPNKAIKTKKLKELVNVVTDENQKRIAISGHSKPDGDSIGASFALANLINQATGKKVDLFVFGDLSKKFSFLNTNENVNVFNIYDNKNFKPNKLKEMFGEYDVAIAVDTALKRLFSNNYWDGIFSNTPKTIKIDHHPYVEILDKETGEFINNNYASYNYVDETCDSTSQIIMQLVDLFKIKPTNLFKQTKEAMYTGLISDTNNFKYARNNLAFEDASLLLKSGVNNVQLQRKFTLQIPSCIHKIRQHLYNNVLFTSDKKIAYFTEDAELIKLKENAYKEGCKEEVQDELQNFFSYLLDLKDVEIAMKVSGTNFSIRSKNADVSALATKYGGGGHTNAAAFCIKKDSNETEQDIINRIISEYQKQLNVMDTYGINAVD